MARPEPDDPLEELLLRAIDAYESGGTEAAEEVVRGNPVARERLQRALGSLDRMGMLGPPGEGAPLVRALGDFRLLRRLGQGGSGVVWLAEQVSVARQVAVKLLHPLQASDAAARERFVREARALGRLRHPHVVAVLAVGQEEGLPYLAMELIEGQGLDERVAEAHAQGAPPPRAEVARWGAEIAGALHAVHGAGLVHRDVKPSNIRIDADGKAVLLDFGLARDVSAATLTRSGAFHGSPHFCSPEHVRGARTVGPAADQFSLGATLYFAWTGRFPFAGETPEGVLRHILTEEPAPLSAVRPDLGADADAVVCRLMEKQAAHRYPDAAAAAVDLAALAAGEPVQARPRSVARRLAGWVRRRPAAAAGLGALAIVVTAVTVALVITLGSLRSERQALAEREQALGDLRDEQARRELDLAVMTLRDLPRQIDGLWPTTPARIEGPLGMDAWLRRADALIGALPAYREQLAALEHRIWPDATPSPEEARWLRAIEGTEAALARRVDDPEGQQKQVQVAWLRDLLARYRGDLLRARIARIDDDEVARRFVALTELVQQVPTLAPLRDRVAGRRAFAATVTTRTIDDQATAWDEARAAIAADPRFGGLELVPQVGLVPLGPDPVSGLEEFAHLETGAAPSRADDGVLQLDASHGLVFVLLPPGRFAMGSNPPGNGDDRNVDRHHGSSEQPVTEVTLSAFFLSKFEMTQEQWQRITGDAPSGHPAGTEVSGERIGARHPVERVSWSEAYRWVRRLQLRLPTEAQWEYAARAGTTTPWWTGDAPRSLDGAANLADAHARREQARHGGSWGFEDSVDDGHIYHAPVGSLRANAFGLHDVLGNVYEWCSDWFNSYDVEPYGRDGRRPRIASSYRVARGGSYSDSAVRLRCALRYRFLPEFTYPGLGLRPARRLVLSR